MKTKSYTIKYMPFNAGIILPLMSDAIDDSDEAGEYMRAALMKILLPGF